MTESLCEFEQRHRRTRALVVEWFGGNCSADRADSILQDTFDLAQTHLLSELPDHLRADILPGRYVSMQEFTSTLLDARARYESRRTGKAFVWLERLSSRVNHYSSVLDVLVQHHPEYVSLVWGAFKFLFVGVMNHEDMVKNLAKACSRFADSLPRNDLTLILYPTPLMREAVARLYSTIVKFIIQALVWYRQGRLRHVVSSIASPWVLDFESQMNEAERHAQLVDQLAQSASRAELREAHFQINQTRMELQLARGEIKQLTSFVEDGFRKMTEFAIANQSIQARISTDVFQSKATISHVQLGQILSLPFMEDLPTSGQSLAYCNSFLLRRKVGWRNHLLPSPHAIQEWSRQASLSFVITDSGNASHPRDFVVNMLGALRRLGLPILWVLPSSASKIDAATTLYVVRTLLYQALQINPSVANATYPITVAHLREASTDKDWLKLLGRALDGLPTVYIIFDMELVTRASNNNRETATRFLIELAKHIGPEKAKIVVSSHGFETRYAKGCLGSEAVTVVRPAVNPGPLRAVRHQRARAARTRRR